MQGGREHKSPEETCHGNEAFGICKKAIHIQSLRKIVMGMGHRGCAGTS